VEEIGFEEVGCDRLYETMVFPAMPSTTCACCRFVPANFGELDMRGYNDPGDAYRGHLKLCEEWSVKEAQVPSEP
jgi:hypothetical protein